MWIDAKWRVLRERRRAGREAIERGVSVSCFRRGRQNDARHQPYGNGLPVNRASTKRARGVTDDAVLGRRQSTRSIQPRLARTAEIRAERVVVRDVRDAERDAPSCHEQQDGDPGSQAMEAWPPQHGYRRA
jgi:hypothetical protein